MEIPVGFDVLQDTGFWLLLLLVNLPSHLFYIAQYIDNITLTKQP